ncbi:ABC transporter ATP-binding protein [Petrocella sp. FN5]|uniref:ABC transporter ATP-binding protein n=1 Tax=Petrocella sp. FN5 TaxID=3032002 RepID=UPI0023D98B76|nr:ABC transporter ATP-binding protein [Petrocella sp. FN5]MDF1615906.1 ABC transporter ATP-binding protein [Petrocella sp. FN5]
MSKILEVKNLSTSFYTHMGEVQAVRGNSFSMEKGDILGIVGESGSGKSVTALSIMGLIDHPGKIKDGEIIFNGEVISTKNNEEMCKIRGKEISMIFQDPMTSLNPVFTIKNLMVEVIRRHQKVSKKKALEIAIDKLRMVGIPEPEKRIHAYPHEFSGGMRQRAMIATALSCNPKLLIADEPTTALDVTIQAQILEIMKKLASEIDTSIMIITHDLGVIAETCKHMIVMYGGMIMEKGTVDEIFHSPQHPYTRGLMNSVPRMDAAAKERLIPIPGSPPDLLNPPKGCPFSYRCPHAMEICKEEMAPTYKISDGHTSACWLIHLDAPDVEGYIKGCDIDAG